jgi:hypothetical protein
MIQDFYDENEKNGKIKVGHRVGNYGCRMVAIFNVTFLCPILQLTYSILIQYILYAILRFVFSTSIYVQYLHSYIQYFDLYSILQLTYSILRFMFSNSICIQYFDLVSICCPVLPAETLSKLLTGVPVDKMATISKENTPKEELKPKAKQPRIPNPGTGWRV